MLRGDYHTQEDMCDRGRLDVWQAAETQTTIGALEFILQIPSDSASNPRMPMSDARLCRTRRIASLQPLAPHPHRHKHSILSRKPPQGPAVSPALRLPLTLIGVALFPSKEAHRFLILDILWTIDDL